MKRILIVVAAITALTLAFAAPAFAGVGGGGINNPRGNPLYVIIEVNWNGESDNGDWTVWGPAWDPEVDTGDILRDCTDCLDMTNYEFTFHGNTVHFDEVAVDTIVATPQVRHVVLKDKDGDGTYTGSLSAGHYFPWGGNTDTIHYFDRIDYEISFNSDGSVDEFHYLQYEHKKLE